MTEEDLNERFEKLLSVKEAFTCPITQDLMVEPVLLVSSGHTFEKDVMMIIKIYSNRQLNYGYKPTIRVL
jgi:hypothetical protein